MIGTIVALLAAEFAFAARLPRPPAVVACRDYTSWSIFSATGVGPQPDPGILNEAAYIAPRGSLKDSLDSLVNDLHASTFDRGTTQADAASSILSDETALDTACRSVLAAG